MKVSQIAERVKELLHPMLHAFVDSRVAQGLQTYNRYLDDNPMTQRRAAVNELQEIIDGMQYSIKAGSYTRPILLAEVAAQIMEEYPDLTLEEMMEREPEVSERGSAFDFLETGTIKAEVADMISKAAAERQKEREQRDARRAANRARWNRGGEE